MLEFKKPVTIVLTAKEAEFLWRTLPELADHPGVARDSNRILRKIERAMASTTRAPK